MGSIALSVPVLAQGVARPTLVAASSLDAENLISYRLKADGTLRETVQLYLDPAVLKDSNIINGLARLNGVTLDERLQFGQQIKLPASLLRYDLVQAKVAAFRGKVWAATGSIFKPITTETILQEGSLLKTGPDGFVTLILPDNSRVSLPTSSQIRIQRLRSVRLTSALERHFKLEQGHSDAVVVPMQNRRSSFQIDTPISQAVVRGTEFSVTYTPDTKTAWTTVSRGKVAISHSAKDKEFLLLTGRGGRVAAGEPVRLAGLETAPSLNPDDTIQSGQDVTFHVERQSEGSKVEPSRYLVELATDKAFVDRFVRTIAEGPVIKIENLPEGRYHARIAKIGKNGLIGQSAFMEVQRNDPNAGALSANKKARTGLSVPELSEVLFDTLPHTSEIEGSSLWNSEILGWKETSSFTSRPWPAWNDASNYNGGAAWGQPDGEWWQNPNLPNGGQGGSGFGENSSLKRPQGDNTAFEPVRPSAVPEPASWAMMIFGFMSVGICLRHRRKGLT